MMAVKASLEHAQRQSPDHEGEKYYLMSYIDASGLPPTNYGFDTIEDIDIHDIRKESFTLAENGMELVPFQSGLEHEDYDNKAKVEGPYLNEVSSLLKKKTRADQVFIFEYLVRLYFDAIRHRLTGAGTEEGCIVSVHRRPAI